jgi:hypothetical protein
MKTGAGSLSQETSLDAIADDVFKKIVVDQQIMLCNVDFSDLAKNNATTLLTALKTRFLKAKKYFEAKEVCKKLNDKETVERLGRIFYKEKDVQAAWDSFRFTNNKSGLNTLGNYMVSQGDPNIAARIYFDAKNLKKVEEMGILAITKYNYGGDVKVIYQELLKKEPPQELCKEAAFKSLLNMDVAAEYTIKDAKKWYALINQQIPAAVYIKAAETLAEKGWEIQDRIARLYASGGKEDIATLLVAGRCTQIAEMYFKKGEKEIAAGFYRMGEQVDVSRFIKKLVALEKKQQEAKKK